MDLAMVKAAGLFKAVQVNGVTISVEEVAAEAQNHPADKPGLAYRAAARALAIRELLAQEVDRLGIKAAPDEIEPGRRETDEEANQRALLERELTTPRPSAQECRRYYDNNLRHFAGFLPRAQAIRRLGSAALDLCWTAAGAFDGYWEMRLGSWDMAAGVLIAREAGAKVTNLSGGPFTIKKREVLAANANLHRTMLAVLRRTRI